MPSPQPNVLQVARKIIGTIACIFFAPYMLWQGSSALITATLAKSWPTVQGTVISSIVIQTPGRRGPKYTPTIKYDYNVAGTTYTGDRVDNGDGYTTSKSDAEATVARYPKGQNVIVYSNPKSPATAFLEVGMTSDNWISIACGLCMTVLGIIVGRSVVRDLKNNKDAATSSGP